MAVVTVCSCRQREEDHQLAMANYRLGSVNLMLGVANYSRNQALAREQEAVKRRIKEGMYHWLKIASNCLSLRIVPLNVGLWRSVLKCPIVTKTSGCGIACFKCVCRSAGGSSA